MPAQLQDQLGQAKIIITNYHAFQLRESRVRLFHEAQLRRRDARR